MICKYCGAQYGGNKCNGCGKIIPLVKRSTEMDNLMGNSTLPPDPKPLRPQQTYEEGIKEGYQKGLTEGYNNGFKDGKAKVSVPPKPNRPNIKLLAILCTSVFVLGAVISGFVSTKISFSKGTENGIHIAKSTYEPTIEDINSQHKIELERAKTDGYDAGYQEGLKVTPMTSDTPSPTPSVSPEVHSDTTLPTIIQFDFPYSKARHGGTVNEVVKAIQTRLRELGYKEVGKVDGDYGDNTTAAVKKFQREEKLVLDGLTDKPGEVGPITYYALFPETTILNENIDQTDNNEESVTPSAEDTSEKETLSATAEPVITTPSGGDATVTPSPESKESQTESEDKRDKETILLENENKVDNLVFDNDETVSAQS